MLWYSLERPCRGASNEYPQHMFSWRNISYQHFSDEKKTPYLLLWLYFLNLWIEVIHICPNVRYWSEVLCYTILTHMIDLEFKFLKGCVT